MKRIQLFALIGAVALTSSLAFTSCKKDKNEATDQNQTANSKEMVKTEFTISFPTSANYSRSNAPRRMPTQTVQVNAGDFNGLKEMILIPFATAGEITSSDKRLGSNINLSTNTIGETAGSSLTDANGVDLTSSKERAKIFSDVSIPVGTASFLFYAKSNLSGTTPSDFFKNGNTLVQYANSHDNTNFEPADLTFNPVQIHTSLDMNSDTKGTALLSYLNAILATSITDGDGNVTKWKDSPSLKDLYTQFATTNTGGSSAHVLGRVQALYDALIDKYSTDDMSKAIVDSIKTKTTESSGKLTFNDDDLKDFPANLNLPDGAAKLVFDSDNNSFSYASNSVNGVIGTTETDMVAHTKYVYPAELLYGVNTTIKTANTAVLQAAYSSTTSSWSDLLAAAYTAGSSTMVSPSTRSVALVKPIQYGVGLFQVEVAATATTLRDKDTKCATPYDASATDPTTTGNEINIADKLTLTGVLVSSQNKVDFMFKETAANDNYVIYDKEVNTGKKVTTTSTENVNYTLVYQTPAPTDDPKSIKFALEFLNEGDPFIGADGQVPTGGKFYLIGQLKYDESTDGYKSGMQGYIFKQDYKTTAKCTFNSLQQARNTIPDLRNPKMELGLSVDLSWQEGHSFTVNTWD